MIAYGNCSLSNRPTSSWITFVNGQQGSAVPTGKGIIRRYPPRLWDFSPLHPTGGIPPQERRTHED
jgi:hypothetical protein